MLAYLAGPYTHKAKSREIGVNKPDHSSQKDKVEEERWQVLSQVAAKLQEAGINCISPITQGHILDRHHGLKKDSAWWIQKCLEVLVRCDILIILTLPGWKESEGVQTEISFAQQKSMPILYIDTNLRIVAHDAA